MKKLLQSILQKVLGFDTYLVFFSWFKIKTLRWDKKEGDFNYFLDLLSPESHVLDIGANIGIMTGLIARQCPKGKIHAFEPIPDNFRALERIVAFLKIRQVVLYKMALGEKKDTVEMLMPIMEGVKMQGLSHIRHETIDGFEGKDLHFEANMEALDNLPFWREEPVHAIKMDVENYEQFVLEGAKELLATHKPIIYTELWDNENRYRCFEIVSGLGYRIQVLENGALIDFQKEKHTHQNFFFVPH